MCIVEIELNDLQGLFQFQTLQFMIIYKQPTSHSSLALCFLMKVFFIKLILTLKNIIPIANHFNMTIFYFLFLFLTRRRRHSRKLWTDA